MKELNKKVGEFLFRRKELKSLFFIMDGMDGMTKTSQANVPLRPLIVFFLGSKGLVRYVMGIRNN